MTTRGNLDEAIRHAGSVARNDRSKWDAAYEVFADELGVTTGVIGKLLTQEKQLGNRIVKEMSEVNPRYIILSIVAGGDDEVRLSRVQETLTKAKLPAARCTLIVEYNENTGKVTPLELQVYQPDEVTAKLAETFGLTAVAVNRAESASDDSGGMHGVVGGATKPIVLVPMVIDDRIRRAIRLSILTTTAVLLVGPPGTGKTTLLFDAIDEIRANPEGFGFEHPIGEPIPITPDESWTARELIGGMTIAEDETLKFREGFVLRAIREDRWLVLDEANRADLDKIFGALLTWLSDQTVDLGPVSTEADAPGVQLAWATGPASNIVTTKRSYEDEGGDVIEEDVPTRYEAGGEWRLLGTYNALDAQRVFRFGQALGRRFVRVPIPPLAPDDFVVAAEPLLVKLPVGIREAVAGLYEAHFAEEETQLGPALFMRIPDYVQAGLAVVDDEGEGWDDDDGGGSDSYGRELLAEAYLVNAGAFLARYDEVTLDALGDRIGMIGALSEAEWQWVRDLSRHLG